MVPHFHQPVWLWRPLLEMFHCTLNITPFSTSTFSVRLDRTKLDCKDLAGPDWKWPDTTGICRIFKKALFSWFTSIMKVEIWKEIVSTGSIKLTLLSKSLKTRKILRLCLNNCQFLEFKSVNVPKTASSRKRRRPPLCWSKHATNWNESAKGNRLAGTGTGYIVKRG